MSRYPIIVLDGPDGVGKTTLAEALCEFLGAKYLHLTYRWPNKMFDYHTAALFYVLREAQHRPVVLDRWWPSEIVYADAYRGGSKWPLADRMFEKAALLHGFSYVFCLPKDREAYLQHYNELKGRREEMYDSGMDRVYAGFERIYHQLEAQRPSVQRYDFMTEGHELAFVIQRIIEVAEDNRWATPGLWFDSGFMNITGSFLSAKYVLVGDELKPKTRREVWPFFEYGNSSLFLAETLESMNVPESELIFMNAKHHDQAKTDHVLAELASTDVVKFVALGNKAGNHLSSLNIPFKETYHPQYYRRFSRDTIVRDLTEAMK